MKIYTYANPFTLHDESFWDEVRLAPHFCVSQTLVQGLCRHYGRTAFQYIYTADRMINALYPAWYQNVELNIEQYISVSRQIEQITNTKLAKAMKFNQQSLVEALRFAVTLDLDADQFDQITLPQEQRAFLDLYRRLHGMPCWCFDDRPDQYRERLISALEDTFAKEMEQFLSDMIVTTKPLHHLKEAKTADQVSACLAHLSKKKDELSVRRFKELEHLTALSIKPQLNQISHVVFHAIHQFTPKILSVIKAIEAAGIEIIFLFNYQDQYRHVYETWDNVYAWTGCEIPHAQQASAFDCRIVGECIGNMLEGRRSGDVRLDNTILLFQNRTAFADHVSACFAHARNHTQEPTQTLSNMSEQFYGVKSDGINDILKFYFPEQFGERHFLSYPIGQFILSLYNMWDEQKGLLFDDALIRECLSVNIWKFHDKTPISLYEKIKGYISDLTDLDSILDRLAYLHSVVEKIDHTESNPIFNKFPFFGLSAYDVRYFIDILKDIVSIAHELFNKETSEPINFRDHFKKLINMINMKMVGNKYVNEQELKLVNAVQNRLSSMRSQRAIVGSIDDLKQTIHYYLQNESEDKTAHWIVRNFEQIDGGVLLSPYTKAKTYHLALLSDRNMKQLSNDFFPWPLSAEMLLSQATISQDCQTIITSYREYRNFLRYCVFYGTYFLDSRKQIQFSYVEKNEDENEKEIPYYILTLLGLETVSPEASTPLVEREHIARSIEVADEEIDRFLSQVTQHEQEVFITCPYRYLLSHTLEEKDCFDEVFDSRRLFSLLLYSETWRKNVGIPRSAIREKMLLESEKLKPYFPFWKTVDFIDLENMAYFYLSSKNMITNGRLQPYHANHVRRKMTFKDSRLSITKPYTYEPARLKSYLQQDNEKEPFNPPTGEAEHLCEACNQRGVCMRQYLITE